MVVKRRKIMALLFDLVFSNCLKTFHWSWMCEHDDDKMVLTIRLVNAVLTGIIWTVFVFSSTEFNINISATLKMSIVQVTCISN